MKPKKPRITKPRLKWAFNTHTGVWEPYHRVTWTDSGKRKERAILLKWEGDAELLDEKYWACEAGRHEKQAPPPSKHSWRVLITAWRNDPRIQKKLKPGTKASYRKDMDRLLGKNADKKVEMTTRKGLRDIHAKLSDTPRKADKYIVTVKLLWNYGANKLDWPLGENPAKGIDLYGPQREFLPWPEWLVQKLSDAPQVVATACALILNTGQRPNAAIGMRRDAFDGEWMTVRNEKGDENFEIFCPHPLRDHLSTLPLKGAYILSKNLTEHLGYSAVEHRFRRWRSQFGEDAKQYSMHGLRKLAIIRLAESGASDAEIQAITDQSIEMVAFYRKKANRRTLSKAASERNRNRT